MGNGELCAKLDAIEGMEYSPKLLSLWRRQWSRTARANMSDVTLCAKLDSIEGVEYSPKWLKEQDSYSQHGNLTRNLFRNLTTTTATPDGRPSPTMSPLKVKIALCQMAVCEDKGVNIKRASEIIGKAAGEGAQLVVLPEMWNCPYSNDSFPVYAEDIDSGNSPSISALVDAAKLFGITLVGGSVPERAADGSLYNTCCVIDKAGTILAKKVHLFDIDIPGKITFKESLTLAPGGGPTVVDTDAGRLGIGICYDMRFPEMAQIYAARGAFNMTTGPVHWELLQKARAVDNQLYVVSCSPARNPESSYQGSPQVSMPTGDDILATTEHDETIVYAELDYAQILATPERKEAIVYAELDYAQILATTEHEEPIVNAELDSAQILATTEHEELIVYAELDYARILATTEHEETIVHAEPEYAQIVERRTNIPVTKQKRSDL
eukprot:gene19219-25839_t